LAKAAAVTDGQHFVGGLFQEFPEQLRSRDIPATASLTIVAWTATEGCKTVTAPVLDERGVPKFQTVYVTTLGKQVPTLKWSVVAAKALPAATASTIAAFMELRIADQWAVRSRNFKRSAAEWLRSLSVPQADIIDLLNPLRRDDGACVMVNVRVHLTQRERILAASGAQGVICKELSADGNATPATFGTIAWCKRQHDETGATFIARAHAEAETSQPCLGLAFSNSGSVGLRLATGKVAPTSWRINGVPYTTSIDGFATWLSDNNFTNVNRDSIRRRVARRSGQLVASFVFRGVHPDGPNSCHTLELPDGGDDPIYLTCEPFRPQIRGATFQTLRSGTHEWRSDAQTPSAAEKAGSAVAPAVAETEVSEAKRAKGSDGAPAGGVPALTKKVELLTELGLSVHPVSCDGSCFFRSVAWHFKVANKKAIEGCAGPEHHQA
jgi:hypothetical protein